MRVISKKMLREFWEIHADAKEQLQAWHKVVRKAQWRGFDDIRATYGRTVDRVGGCYVFNIKGKDYRLIARISPDWTIVFTCIVLTHAEYNRDAWKETCHC